MFQNRFRRIRSRSCLEISAPTPLGPALQHWCSNWLNLPWMWMWSFVWIVIYLSSTVFFSFLQPGHVLQQDEQPLRQDCHVSALLQQEQGGRVQEWVLPGPLLSRGLYSTHPQVPRYRIELYSAHPIQPTRILVLIKGTIPRDFWPPVFNHSNLQYMGQGPME